MSMHSKPAGTIEVHPDFLNDVVDFYKTYVDDGGDARWINSAISIEANAYIEKHYPGIEYETGTPQHDEHVFLTHPDEQGVQRLGSWGGEKWDAKAMELADRGCSGETLKDELQSYVAGAVHSCVNSVVDVANADEMS